ncbi:nucleoside hydrolase [Paenibacillus agricola]|uniref:Nucleoside hydrolase n=1 Tax=Paenibacillus agricola TaxID=2716264 RepID=A0ABX0J1Z5_9BACL|nr:nucleoside hydrolase [Paenibacillus agricola]NHN29470.1 nucleoside hydrolase [Paenibacillus agricola]
MESVFPDHKKLRVIINTDTKAEADDQYAIVHGLLTPSFEIHGMIAAHFGKLKSPTSMQDSREEIDLLIRLMGLEGRVRAENGALHEMPDEQTPVDSPGARLIIEEALKEDDRMLNIAFCGPLTDMASALLLEPAIEKRKIRVIWIGGYTWPLGGKEYNLANDIHAANVVFKSKLEVWQVPYNAYRMMPVSHAELIEKVYNQGEIGAYLVEQLLAYNSTKKEAIEYRSLGDSPVIGIMMYPECGRSEWRPAPEIDPQMNYIHNGQHRVIKVYETVDSRFIMEDFFAKLAQFARKNTSS